MLHLPRREGKRFFSREVGRPAPHLPGAGCPRSLWIPPIHAFPFFHPLHDSNGQASAPAYGLKTALRTSHPALKGLHYKAQGQRSATLGTIRTHDEAPYLSRHIEMGGGTLSRVASSIVGEAS